MRKRQGGLVTCGQARLSAFASLKKLSSGSLNQWSRRALLGLTLRLADIVLEVYGVPINTWRFNRISHCQFALYGGALAVSG